MIILLLVEGVTDKIFYEALLKKLYHMSKEDLYVLPNEFIRFINNVKGLSREEERRRRISILKLKDNNVIIIGCGGFKPLTTFLGLFLKYEKVDVLIKKGLKCIIVIMDRDHNPVEVIRSKLASLNIEYSFSNNSFYLKEHGLLIMCIAQGLLHSRSTDQLEDYVKYIASKHYTSIARALQVLKRVLKEGLILNNYL